MQNLTAPTDQLSSRLNLDPYMSKTVLACDIGYGNTKIVFGHTANQWSEMCFRSVAPKVLVDGPALAGGIGGSLDRVNVHVNGANYLVGPEAHVSGGGPVLSTDFVLRDEYLALLRGAIHYAMRKRGTIIKQIDVLVLGLPVANFQARQADLMRVGRGPHTVPVPLAMSPVFGREIDVTVGRVVVLHQPMGALHYVSSQGATIRKDGVHMVIDPGYNTFDWFVSVGVRPDLQRSGSLQGGVSQLLKVVANAAGNKLGVGTLNLAEVEKGLSAGVMLAHGKQLNMVEFRPIIEAAAAQVVDRFVNSLDMSLGLDRIILTGGGASFYADALRKAFSGYSIALDESSVMSNARGFFVVGETLAAMM